MTDVVRHRADGWLALGCGLGNAALSPLATRTAPRWERAALTRTNGGTDLPPLRVPQQLGTPWTLGTLSVGAFWLRRPHLATTSLLGLGLVKAVEAGTKKVAGRRRPGQVLDDVRLRDDAPRSDDRLDLSGHAAKAACAAAWWFCRVRLGDGRGSGLRRRHRRHPRAPGRALPGRRRGRRAHGHGGRRPAQLRGGASGLSPGRLAARGAGTQGRTKQDVPTAVAVRTSCVVGWWPRSLMGGSARGHATGSTAGP